MQRPLRPNPTDAMLPTSRALVSTGDPFVRDRSRTMPVAGSACSQKNMNDRFDRSSSNASSAAASVGRWAGAGAGATTDESRLAHPDGTSSAAPRTRTTTPLRARRRMVVGSYQLSAESLQNPYLTPNWSRLPGSIRLLGRPKFGLVAGSVGM